ADERGVSVLRDRRSKAERRRGAVVRLQLRSVLEPARSDELEEPRRPDAGVTVASDKRRCSVTGERDVPAELPATEAVVLVARKQRGDLDRARPPVRARREQPGRAGARSLVPRADEDGVAVVRDRNARAELAGVVLLARSRMQRRNLEPAVGAEE